MRVALMVLALIGLTACHDPVSMEPYAGPGALDATGKRALLTLARRTLRASVMGKQDRPLQQGLALTGPRFKRKQAVFATLYEDTIIAGYAWVDPKGLQRACAGHLKPLAPLTDAIVLTTRTAAVADPRYSRVDESELDDITIELSLIQAPRRVLGPEEIVVGRHGVILSLGKRSATYLPQFIAQRGWTVATTLERLCKKAGLPPEAWRRPEARLQVYGAQVISERRPGGGP